MATLTKDQILDGIAELSVIELSELLKEFEERFGVTAAAPVAVAAAARAGGRRRRRWRRGGEDRVRRHPDRRRRQEDPGHQGGPRPHQPRPQGGQGPGRGRSEARPGEGQQGRRREGEGGPRGRRRHRRAQVVPVRAGSGAASVRRPAPRPGSLTGGVGFRSLSRTPGAARQAVAAEGLYPGPPHDKMPGCRALCVPDSVIPRCRRAPGSPDPPSSSRRPPATSRIRSPSRTGRLFTLEE